MLHSAGEQLCPFIKGAALIIAAANQHNRLFHRQHRADGCVHIRPLGVIIIVHTVHRRNIFDAMCYACKSLQHRANGIQCNPRTNAHCRRRHHVFIVMHAQNLQFIHMNQGFVDSAPAHLDGIPVQINAFRKRFGGIEEKYLCRGFIRHFSASLVPMVQNTEILCGLLCKNSFLHGNVNVHGFMSVQVVGCNIQHCADMRMKFLRLFHLEAADFRNHPILFGQPLYLLAVGNPDIADNRRAAVSRFHDFACQRGCGCFAVCACDCRNRAGCQAVRQLHLTDDLDSCLLRRRNKGQVAGDAGA